MVKQKIIKRRSREGMALANKGKGKKVTKEFKKMVDDVMRRYDKALRELAKY